MPWRQVDAEPLVRAQADGQIKPDVVVQFALEYAKLRGGTWPTAQETARCLKQHTGDKSVRHSSVFEFWILWILQGGSLTKNVRAAP